jgi:hypothetical protein
MGMLLGLSCMAMVWKLHRGLGIPAETLIKQAA